MDDIAKPQRLHSAVATVCPIDGVYLGDINDRRSWVVTPTTEATAEQISAAERVLSQIDLNAPSKPELIESLNAARTALDTELKDDSLAEVGRSPGLATAANHALETVSETMDAETKEKITAARQLMAQLASIYAKASADDMARALLKEHDRVTMACVALTALAQAGRARITAADASEAPRVHAAILTEMQGIANRTDNKQ